MRPKFGRANFEVIFSVNEPLPVVIEALSCRSVWSAVDCVDVLEGHDALTAVFLDGDFGVVDDL